jgi:hypothetical protein
MTAGHHADKASFLHQLYHKSFHWHTGIPCILCIQRLNAAHNARLGLVLVGCSLLRVGPPDCRTDREAGTVEEGAGGEEAG